MRRLHTSAAVMVGVIGTLLVARSSAQVSPAEVIVHRVARALAERPTVEGFRSPTVTLPGGALAVRGEVLVEFRPGVQRAAANATLRQHGAVLQREYSTVGVSLARITTGEGVGAVVQRLRRDPNVASVSPNYIFQRTEHLTRPTDPEFPRQWHLDNRGQNPPDEKFADTGAIANRFENGETIYDDVDASGDVSAGDVVLTGPGAPAGTALLTFPAVSPSTAPTGWMFRIADLNGSGSVDPCDAAYHDIGAGNANAVGPGDIRLTASGGFASGNGFAPGTAVVAGDADVGTALLNLGFALARYTDANGNGRFDGGECVYYDVLGVSSFGWQDWVSPGDFRVTACGGAAASSVVVPGDPDLNNPLHRFRQATIGTIDADIDAPQSWEHSTDCSDIIVAVIDSGVDPTHPDLAANMYVNPGETPGDGVDDDANGIVDDVNGASVCGRYGYVDADCDLCYDPGEGLYLDDDDSGTVTPGDTLIQGAAGMPRVPLTRFVEGIANRREKYVESVAPAGLYSTGETIVLDNDNDNMYDAGEPVLIGAAPAAGTALQTFLAGERHVDPNADGFYTGGEFIYQDFDANRRVTPGDVRITAVFGFGANTAVAAGDADVGLPLIGFDNHPAFNERFVDADGDGLYTAAEFIYDDKDNSSTVTTGDTRITAVPGSGGAKTTVAAGDADQVAAAGLVSFPVDIESGNIQSYDDVTHGTAAAGVIGAVGSNPTDGSGICWTARIMGVRAGTNSFRASALVAAVDYISFMKLFFGDDIRVVNMSLGGKGQVTGLGAAIAFAGGLDILFTIAAGNDGESNDLAGPPREAVYTDADGFGIVTAGDNRRTQFGNPTIGAGPGAVAAGDPDVGNNLVPFYPVEKHTENGAANGTFEQGERTYIDMDNSNTVTANDIRLDQVFIGGTVLSPGQVMAGDADIGTALVAFAANEMHIDGAATVGGNTIDSSASANTYFEGNSADFPATIQDPSVISVAATDNRDRLAVFSSFGTSQVHLAAPGQDILTLRGTYRGGGMQYIDGTSFAAPTVAGILAQLWTQDAPFLAHTASEIKDRLLTGLNAPLAVPHPHGVDPRIGVQGAVSSGKSNDGRARMAAGDDFGDCPDPPYPTTLFAFGARHEDIGEEWLGRDPDLTCYFPPPPGLSDVSPEYDAFDDPAWPPDPDGIQNLTDTDLHDDGIDMIGPFMFSEPGVTRFSTVRVWIDTENNNVIDADDTRYPTPGLFLLGPHGAISHPAPGVHAVSDDKHIWVNAWFDWNNDGDWRDADEHAFLLCANPSDWPTSGAMYEVTFPMPLEPPDRVPGQPCARFRLDYGENCGQTLGPPPIAVGPCPGGFVDFAVPRPLLLENLYGSVEALDPDVLEYEFGVAQFGEVENGTFSPEPSVWDYLCSLLGDTAFSPSTWSVDGELVATTFPEGSFPPPEIPEHDHSFIPGPPPTEWLYQADFLCGGFPQTQIVSFSNFAADELLCFRHFCTPISVAQPTTVTIDVNADVYNVTDGNSVTIHSGAWSSFPFDLPPEYPLNGSYRYNFVPPIHDDCLTAHELLPGTVTLANNTKSMTAPSDPPFSCRFGGPGPGVGSLWYSFVADDTSMLVSTCGTTDGTDSLIAVYAPTDPVVPCRGLQEIACSEDQCGLLSELCVSGLIPGERYYIQFASYSDADRGVYQLQIQPNCASAGGACCFSCPDINACTEETDPSACLAAGGIYVGDGTTCADINCGDYCQADLDGDGDVDIFDFGVFGPNFGSTGVGRCEGDFDCDGDVDVFDFGVFGPSFGCVGPATGSCP